MVRVQLVLETARTWNWHQLAAPDTRTSSMDIPRTSLDQTNQKLSRNVSEVQALMEPNHAAALMLREACKTVSAGVAGLSSCGMLKP